MFGVSTPETTLSRTIKRERFPYNFALMTLFFESNATIRPATDRKPRDFFLNFLSNFFLFFLLFLVFFCHRLNFSNFVADGRTAWESIARESSKRVAAALNGKPVKLGKKMNTMSPFWFTLYAPGKGSQINRSKHSKKKSGMLKSGENKKKTKKQKKK